MKKLIYILPMALLFSCGSAPETETETEEIIEEVVEMVEEKPEGPKSPRLLASGEVNGIQIDIDYGSPFVKDRTVWGDLVPYNKVWRAGANETTAITFGSDCSLNGEDLSAGTYAFFVIPKEEGAWTVILNEEWSKEEHDVWGAFDYKEDKDVIRFDVEALWMDDSVESLAYSISESGIVFIWEKVKLEIQVL